MAIIFAGFQEMSVTEHVVAESSLLKSTLTGHIWDAKIQGTVDGQVVDINCDNGVMVKMGPFTHNGLQERTATVAGVKDKVGFVCTPALIKDAYNSVQASEVNFYNKAGKLAKVYEVQGDEYDPDIFGVSKMAFTSADNTIVEGNYVILDGNGGYVAQASAPTMSSYGFVGQIHSIQTGLFYTLVRVAVLQNVDNN